MHIENVSDLKGKTVQDIDDSCTNMWVITFTDGSTARLAAESRSIGSGAVLPCIELWPPVEE